MNISKWLKNNCEKLSNKTVAISGSTGGLGEAVCFHLASLGADFIFLNRNLEKSKKLEEKIKEKFPQCKVIHIKVDMGDINSVKMACEELKKLHFDYLILNSGAYKVENVLQINFYSPFYIAKTFPNVKIVAVGSIAHKNVRLGEKSKKEIKVYGLSKRYLMFSLSQLLKNKNFAIVHPGITLTNITSQYPKIFLPLIKFLMKIIFPSNGKASLSIVKGLFVDCECGQWIGPKNFDIWGKPQLKQLKTFSQEESEKILQLANEYFEKI